MTMITILLAVTCLLPISLVLLGLLDRPRKGDPAPARPRLRRTVGGHLVLFASVYLLTLCWAAGKVWAAAPPDAGGPAEVERSARAGLTLGDGLGMLAVALATAVSVVGASYAVAVVGAAALGALTEKPEIFGRTLVFIGLAEGLAIYGLIVSILMLERLR
jgi:V/A-type H+-transporting ATPase subunit K